MARTADASASARGVPSRDKTRFSAPPAPDRRVSTAPFSVSSLSVIAFGHSRALYIVTSPRWKATSMNSANFASPAAGYAAASRGPAYT